ncbi:MAG: MarR family winged helix-turn-helix transcriptional regulator [Terracidiphilus sp.]
MMKSETSDPVWQFVGSAHLFSSAFTDVLQGGLLRQVAGSRLSFSQLKLLQLLSVAKTQTIGELAAFLGVSNAAASKMVEKLVQQGFLLRAVGENDRRAAHVSLTSRSRRLLADYDEKRREKLAKVFLGCSATELQKLAKLMDQVTAAIVNHSAKPEEICLHCGIYFRGRCLVRDLGGRNCLYQQRAQLRRETERSH